MTQDREFWASVSSRLNDADSKIRLAALEEISGRKEIQATRLKLKALSDNSNQIRKRAGEVLLDNRDPVVVSGLIALLDSDKLHVRATVTDLLTELPPAEVFPVIREQVEDEKLDETLRVKLIPLFVRHASAEHSEKVSKMLQDTNPNVRKAVLDGLCQSDGEWVYPVLIGLLDTEDPGLAERVLQCLSKRKNDSLKSQLFDMLSLNSVAGDRALALLTRMTEKADYAEAAARLSGGAPLMRLRALRLASAIDADRSIEPAWTAMVDPDDRIRDQATLFLSGRPIDDLQRLLHRHAAMNGAALDSSTMERLIADRTPDELAILYLDPLLSDRLRPVIRGLTSETVLRGLGQRLDRNEPAAQRSQLEAIARLGSAESIRIMQTIEGITLDRKTWAGFEGEVRFRHDLARWGFDASPYSLDDLDRLGREKGWQGPEALADLVGRSESLSQMATRRADLVEEIRRQEKAVIKIEPMLAQVDDAIQASDRQKGRRRLSAGAVAASAVMIGVSMYMNWQPGASSHWYFGLILSTAILGLAVWGFRRSMAKTASTPGILNPESGRADLRQKLHRAQEALTKAQAELDAMESRLGSGEMSETSRSLKLLVNILTNRSDADVSRES
ncbi:hypothetical protein JXA80_12250 [bacterium]|nr:hypothetical protein [candidate division CSSED10-310 bacterium]